MEGDAQKAAGGKIEAVAESELVCQFFVSQVGEEVA